MIDDAKTGADRAPDAWGERLQAAFTAEVQAAGVQLSAVQPYDPGTKDYSGPLRAALGPLVKS